MRINLILKGCYGDLALRQRHKHTHKGGIMSNSKSGYEIRADLLSMAQSILYDNLERKINAVYHHNDNHPDDKKSLPSQNFTAQDVISIAAELNEFVVAK